MSDVVYDIDVVIVTHFSAGEVDDCLAALPLCTSITVVDNGSGDDSAIIAERRGATVIRNAVNAGFGAAANQGAAVGRGANILFLNPDAIIDRLSVGRLVDELDRHAELGVVGPRLRSSDGSWQKPWWPFPSARRSAAEAVGVHRLRGEPAADDDNGFVVGACLLIRRAAFERVGGFDPRFWLYGEEADLCKRVVDSGYGVRLVEAAIAEHIGGVSGQREPGLTFEHFHRGTEHFIAKHEGRTGLLVHRVAAVVNDVVRIPWMSIIDKERARLHKAKLERFSRVLMRHPLRVASDNPAQPTDRDLVVCSLEPWDDVWRRNQFLVRELRRREPHRRVLFVEPAADATVALRARRMPQLRARTREIEPGLTVLTPAKLLPRRLGDLADRLIARSVATRASKLGFENATLWINDVNHVFLSERTGWPTLYDITDDWLLAEAPPRIARALRNREHRLLRRANVVVVCSSALERSRASTNGDVRLIPNAVDIEHFKKPRSRPADLPIGPVAVYVGTLHDERVDVPLIEDLARSRPALSVVLVGPDALSAASQARLSEVHNVYRLGPRPYADVPAYLQHADVVIVPHIVSPFTESLDPIKAYECLAIARPTVATPVAGFRELDGALRIAGRDAFTAAVDSALSGVDLRERTLPAPSWAERGRQFGAALDDARRQRRRLKVAYVGHCALLSGGELALARLLPALEDVEAHVILGEDGPLVPLLRENGATVEVLPMDERARGLRKGNVSVKRLPLSSLVGSARYVLELRRRLVAIDPDIVHTNTLKAAIYGGLAGRLAGVPVVWHVRDRIAADYLPAPAVRLVRVLSRLLPSAVVANSAATLATVDPPQRMPKAVVHSVVVHDIASLPEIDLRRPGHGALHIGMLGRLAPWKGQHVFIEAFARAFPDGDHRAVIAGSAMFGESDYEAQIRQLARQLGIADRVDFVGFTDDVAGFLSRVDVLVHASVIPEPFGQVVIEGMAAALPVVAANAGGPAEVIEHESNGLLVDPGDVDGLAAALRSLLDANRRQRFATAATKRAADFAPDQLAPKIMDVYAAVLR